MYDFHMFLSFCFQVVDSDPNISALALRLGRQWSFPGDHRGRAQRDLQWRILEVIVGTKTKRGRITKGVKLSVNTA